MLASFALLLQASAAPDPLPPIERLDILLPLSRPKCESGIGDEIVVCGSREDEVLEHRLERLPERYEERPLKAEMNLGPVRAGVTTESSNIGGFTSNRVMLKLKLPF